MSTVLDEVTTRLRQGLAVEMVRGGDGWQVASPTRAERYERPEAGMPHATGTAPRQVLLTRSQVAAVLGISRRAVHRRASAGHLAAVQNEHGHRRYPASAVRAALIERLTSTPTPPPLTQYGFLRGEHEVYQVEHIARRPGGDLDVVVSATPYDHRARTYIAFRRDVGAWRPLVGRWSDIHTAVTEAACVARFAGWDSPELAALLNTLEASS